ncbi:MAG: SDR family oxidoreductase, partial [Phycisphaerales bacterium]
REQTLRDTAALLPGPWAALPCDMADTTAAAVLAAQTVSATGGLDVLVNNAAVALPALISEATPRDIDAMFAANGAGPVALISAAWPHLEHAALSHGRASIVNISSMATLDPFPNLYAYAASKAALNVAALAAHNAGRATGIRAFSLAPGAVETQMLRAVVTEHEIPASRTLRPETIAAVVLECVRGDRDAQSGQTIPILSP